MASAPIWYKNLTISSQRFSWFVIVKIKNMQNMVIVFLENKEIVHSFSKQCKYLHIKFGLNNNKYLYLVQRSHNQFTLFLMVCNSENKKTYKIW